MDEKLWIYLEVRPRLCSVNAYIPNCNKGKKTVLVSNEGNLISVKDSDLVLHDYSWPVQSYGALCSKSVHGLTFHNEELTVRFKLKGGSMSFMNLKQSFKPISRNFIKPCHLSSDEKTQSVFCANCKTFLAQLNIERYLPLPSMDWRGGIQDWFCCGNHGSKNECSSMAIETRFETALCLSNEKHTDKSTNDKLHETGLGPVPSDLLYSPCQIRVNMKYFEDLIRRKSEHLSSDVIQCKKCQSDIGDLNEKDGFVQIWHHTVVLNEKLFKPKGLETFLLLIGGICAEHDWIPMKIRLNSKNSIMLKSKNERNDKQNIFIWMLEPDLKVMKIQANDILESGTQKELSLMKVMYNENLELEVDQELSVPHDVIQAGLEHLLENSVMIPKNQRKDSDFHISYINLDPVLLGSKS